METRVYATVSLAQHANLERLGALL